MPNASERKTTLEERLEKIQSAINGTLDRNAMSYSIGGRALSSLSIKELMQLEAATLNELERVERVIAGSTRFGGIGFKGVSA